MKIVTFILVHIIMMVLALASYTVILNHNNISELCVGLVGIASCFGVAGLYNVLIADK
jgi:hypothetical protein